MSQASVKEALMKTIHGIQTRPNMSKVVLRAETEWVEDVRRSSKVHRREPHIPHNDAA